MKIQIHRRQETDEQGRIDKLVPKSRYLAGAYNDVLQRELSQGWTYLTKGMAAAHIPGVADGILLDQDFVGYLCGSSVYRTFTEQLNLDQSLGRTPPR